MKQIGVCPDCKETFECTNENELDIGGYKCPNGHTHGFGKLSTEFVPITVDEAQEMAECPSGRISR